MILKSFQSKNFEFNKFNYYLFYGENEGLKGEFLESNILKKIEAKKYYYDEKELLENYEIIVSGLLNSSFFEERKILIISRTSEKILQFVEELIDREIKDITVIIKAPQLDKKSKLRSYFEKNKETICVPFYQDESRSLSSLANDFFRKKKISISQEAVNIITDRCRGDRLNLKLELDKIENYILDKNNISIEEVIKITNLAENFTVSELIDNCLKKNTKKTMNILNENNYNNEDCILILRTFLTKAKRLLQLKERHKSNNNIDDVINSFKPPIFWKEKDSVKNQIISWSLNEVKELIFQINDIELTLKKSFINPLNIVSDFLINKSKKINS